MTCDIRIKSPTYPIKGECVISHSEEDTIFRLKTKIKTRLANDLLRESAQKLIYAGHVLDDNKTLAQLNIPGSATFHLVTAPEIRPSNTPARQETLQQPGPKDADHPPASGAQEDRDHRGQTDSIETNNTESSRAPTADASASNTTAQDSVAEQPSPAEPGAQVPMPAAGGHGAHSHAYQFMGDRQNVQRTNVKYDLCYIDGFPYLIRAPDRHRHGSRRWRPTTSSGTATTTATPTNTAAVVRQTVFNPAQSAAAAIVRHHQVDLPATAAIPVRTADGRRALILSPEGVRAMAAQGVNIDANVANRGDGILGISSSSIRRLMQNGIPHGWLFLKLAFLVAMLGSNSSWYRFIVLNLCAVGIFFWQSGLLANVFNRTATQAAVPAAPAAGARAPVENAESPTAGAVASETPVGGSSHGSGHGARIADAQPEVPLLHNLGRAFLSSIVPSVASPTAVGPVAAGPARPQTPVPETPAQDENARDDDTTLPTDDDELQHEHEHQGTDHSQAVDSSTHDHAPLDDAERELEALRDERAALLRERESLQQQLQDW